MTKYTLAFPNYSPLEPCEFQNLKDTGSQLVIILINENKLIRIIFEEHLFYRKMEEGDAYKYALDLSKQVSLGEVFYKAEMSDLLIWLHERSFGAKDPEKLQHYIFAAANDWIDVISWTAPKIRIRQIKL